MNRQEATEVAKEYLESYVENITEHSAKGNRKAYVCPICGSGTGRNKTGAFTITKDGLKWKCFACDRGGDTLDLIGYVEDIDAPCLYAWLSELHALSMPLYALPSLVLDLTASSIPRSSRSTSPTLL